MQFAPNPTQQSVYETQKQFAQAQPSYLSVVSATDPTGVLSRTDLPTSYSSTVSEDSPDKPYLLWTVMIAILFLVLVTVIIVTVAVNVSGPPTQTETTVDVFRDQSDNRPPPVIYAKQTRPQRDITEAPHVPTLASVPETPPGPPTISPRQALIERPLVCTMGSETASEAMFPDDGLCDYIFYDSIYKDGRNVLLNPAGFQKDMQMFLDVDNKYKITAFGMAFAFKSSRFLKRNLENSGRSRLAYFWDRNIYHFGILDTPTVSLTTRELDDAIDSLQMIDTQAETQRAAGHPSFIFFALTLFNYTMEDHYELIFKNRYQPDVLIAQGHYYYGDNLIVGCRIMPPTAVTRPKEADSSYRHDLISLNTEIDGRVESPLTDLYNHAFQTMAVDTIRKLSRMFKPDKLTLWTVSVTMKGRWTTPFYNGPVEFLDWCYNDPSGKEFGSYKEICRDPNFEQQITYSAEHGAVLASHARQQRVLAFDNEEGFCKKLCRIQGEQPQQRFGIAAFDLDYDDFSNTCSSMNKYGNFSRLRALRKIVEFFRTSFTTDADEAACLQLVT